MRVNVGVVGPHDLVSLVLSTASDESGVVFVPLPYAHESQARSIVTDHGDQVDGWIFTGPIPYFLSRSALTRPATYVEYSGSTLLTAVVQLLRDGHDVTRLSIDSLHSEDVTEALQEAGIATEDIRVLPYSPELDSTSIAEFHLALRREGYIAITCVSSVYEQLVPLTPCIRLAPSRDAIRTASTELLLLATNQVNQDSHVVIGLLDAKPPIGLESAELTAITAAMSAYVSTAEDGSIVIVTNRAGVQRATAGLTFSPLRESADDGSRTIHLGFGLGNSASEAGHLAGRALLRAAGHAASTAVVSLRSDVDITLKRSRGENPRTPASRGISVIAAQAGLSTANIERLRHLREDVDGEPVTTREIATHLEIQMRTARRIVQRLELAGYAERIGQRNSISAGRPLTLYRLLV